MIPITNLSGRLGNQMFQLAFCYAYARNHNLDIYFQNPSFFDKYKDEIKTLFGSGIGKLDMVGIHVRRGDYVNNGFYVDLSDTTYYDDAMIMFPNDKFLVFSDDIEWCKKQDRFKKCEFSEGRSDVEDMNLLASCKGIIMANSSFSWWASYLSDAKVVAPLAWFRDGQERTVCPKEWIRI